MLTATGDLKLEQLEIKTALDKDAPNIYSICPLVLIFEESLCGCTGWERDMTHYRTPFKGLKSIITDGCFLSGPKL